MNLIKKQRIKNKISQSKLANLCNVKQPHISKIENNKEIPSVELIFRLSNNLNISPIKLFCFFYMKDKYNLCEDYICNFKEENKKV